MNVLTSATTLIRQKLGKCTKDIKTNNDRLDWVRFEYISVNPVKSFSVNFITKILNGSVFHWRINCFVKISLRTGSYLTNENMKSRSIISSSVLYKINRQRAKKRGKKRAGTYITQTSMKKRQDKIKSLVIITVNMTIKNRNY